MPFRSSPATPESPFIRWDEKVFSSNRCDSSLGLVDAGGIHHDSDWRCWLGVTSAHKKISLVLRCPRTGETDSSWEPRGKHWGYFLKNTPGPPYPLPPPIPASSATQL